MLMMISEWMKAAEKISTILANTFDIFDEETLSI